MNRTEFSTPDKAGLELRIFAPQEGAERDGLEDGPERRRLLDLLGLPQASRPCQRGDRLHLRDRAEPRRQRAARLSCSSWGCPACAPRLRAEKGLHFGGLLLACYDALFGGRSEPDGWPADRKALTRAAASWVRVLAAGGGSLLLGTAGLPAAIPVGAEEAVRRLGKALAAIRRPRLGPRQNYRPVTCSAGWSPDPRDPPTLERIGRVATADPDAVLALLWRHGLPTNDRRNAPQRIDGGWTVSWTIPAFWDEERTVALAAELADLSPESCIRRKVLIQDSGDIRAAVEAFIAACTNVDWLRHMLRTIDARLQDLEARSERHRRTTGEAP